MRSLALLLIVAVALAVPAAADQYSGFQQFADQGSLKPFARDLGGILGSATFHSGRPLGFSGFDLGAHGGMQFLPEKGDTILRHNGVKEFGVPWVQAEIGMPFKFDGFVRGISYQGLTIAGGGVRYGLLKSNDKPWAPQLLATISAHSLVDQYFSASHFGANLVGSMGTPKFTPYLGAGFDRTRLVARTATLADPNLAGATVTTMGTRFTGGVQWRPWTFVYLNVAYVLLHGQSGSEAGLGIRF
jgi:hypothetical protein